MQISTKLFIVCVLAATTAPFSSRGADTDAQMKAREALRQKMSELNAQPAETNTAPAVTVPSNSPESKPAAEPAAANPTPTPAAAPAETVKTVPAPTPTPASTVESTPTPAPAAPAPVVKTTRKPKPPPVAKTAPASAGVTASRPDSERIAKARQALEEKMQELNAQGTVASQPAVVSEPPANRPAEVTQPRASEPVTTQPPPSRPVVASQPPPASPSTPVYRTPEISSTSQPSVSAETSEATEPLPTPPPVIKSAQTEPGKKSKQPREARLSPEPRPIYALPPGPPPPVSADKVQKLNILLQQYQADRITPEQYHQERAKILAGP
jgi:hypothetical protein